LLCEAERALSINFTSKKIKKIRENLPAQQDRVSGEGRTGAEGRENGGLKGNFKIREKESTRR
jgi:hypothetical protein